MGYLLYLRQNLTEEIKSMERFPMKRALFMIMALFIFVTLYESMQPQGNNGISPGVGPAAQVPYSTFKRELKKGNIRRAFITQTEIDAVLMSPINVGGQTQAQRRDVDRIITPMPALEDAEVLPLLEESGAEIVVERSDETNYLLMFVFNVLPFALIIGFWVWSARKAQKAQQGPFGNFSQVKVRQFDETMPQVKFTDVAGMKAQKQELEEIVDFLAHPEKYERIGGRVPKGVLLMGPPGTGKTLLAQAVAGEAGVPFFSTSASEFIEMFVGVGASRVRDLFKKAREAAPSIVFIDEIDAVGRSRGTGLGGGHDEREQTLNQLLGEMDGFEGHERVIVLAATNRPDVLDSALLRPGRFDRQVVLDMPTMEDREKILKVHTRDLPLDDNVDLMVIARATSGMSGADLANLCNEAALYAARKNYDRLTMQHFDFAKDKVTLGIERPGLENEVERRITACHEAGHTLVARLIPGMDPVQKVTILPRGQALGVTHLVPEEDRHYYPKQFLMGKLAVMLGGRAAELVVLNDTSTGAANDLKRVTELAEKMVCQWGMSDKVGPVTFSRGEEHVFLGKKLAQDKTWSEQMGWIIDQEIEEIVRGAEDNAYNYLKGNREPLDRLTEALLEREELNSEEIDLVIADKPLPEKKVEKKEAPEEIIINGERQSENGAAAQEGEQESGETDSTAHSTEKTGETDDSSPKGGAKQE